MTLPPEFDPAYYGMIHPDLAGHSEIDLVDHYRRWGKSEGRRCSPAAERAAFVAALEGIRPALEIGPFYKPVLTGAGVRYFDVIDTIALRERARQIGGDPRGVPGIDYVGADLSMIGERFRLVLSSHSMEHQPDLIGHLGKVATLLEPAGMYAVLVPDCRYCFDHFLPPSNLAEVVAAHEEKRERHTLAKVIEHRALTTHNDALRHWQGDHGDPNGREDAIRGAIAEHSMGQYVDVHAWQFTPDSLRKIVSAVAPGIGLRPLRVYQTPFGAGEFCAVLQKEK